MKLNVWNDHVNIMKHRGGYPLKPPSQAIDAFFQEATSRINPETEAQTIVLLGVTPEIVSLPWPKNVTIKAFDQSQEMIDAIWEPNASIQSNIEKYYWQSLPLENESADLILGDGCTTQMADEGEYEKLFFEMDRILKPSGAFLMRCFIQPAVRESFEQIIESAYGKEIQYFGSLKWRVAMAAMKDDESSIAVKEIFKTFNQLFPDRNSLSMITGWSKEVIDGIDAYKTSSSIYSFPTLEDLIATFNKFFMVTTVNTQAYELSDRCPIFKMTKKM
ncbi:MAG: class I SAM-dependent methyltransferase [Chlamydiia bacterium]|nr:class I SAM-dependent methyltransferase [Chlamydiia bacterium]